MRQNTFYFEIIEYIKHIFILKNESNKSKSYMHYYIFFLKIQDSIFYFFPKIREVENNNIQT